MSRENKLVDKVKRLIRKAGLPRWLHHYGPKKYEFLNHALARSSQIKWESLNF
jgi:hypothetical protein